MLDVDRYRPSLSAIADRLSGGRSLPIALHEICRELGVVISRSKLHNVQALLVDAKTTPRILLNSGSRLPEAETLSTGFTRRERFLICHELGHLILHREHALKPAGPSEYWQVEGVCDSFARRLLVPDRKLKSIITTADTSPAQRLNMCSYLERAALVSWSVAAHRVADTAHGAAFFRIGQDNDGGLRVTLSTLPNKQAIGRRVRADSDLCRALLSLSIDDGPVELASRLLADVAPLPARASAAAVRVSVEEVRVVSVDGVEATDSIEV